MEIRLFNKSDADQVAQLLQDSIKIFDTQTLPEAQMLSWAPNKVHFQDWEESFLEKFTLVAVVNDMVVGIAQMAYTGHISCFYIHEEFRRQGIGGQLFAALEDYAASKSIPTIHTESSSEDRGFYFQMGFQDVQKQNVLIGGEVKATYVVEKIMITAES